MKMSKITNVFLLIISLLFSFLFPMGNEIVGFFVRGFFLIAIFSILPLGVTIIFNNLFRVKITESMDLDEYMISNSCVVAAIIGSKFFFTFQSGNAIMSIISSIFVALFVFYISYNFQKSNL